MVLSSIGRTKPTDEWMYFGRSDCKLSREETGT
jgi:hypothetical protein